MQYNLKDLKNKLKTVGNRYFINNNKIAVHEYEIS